MKAELKEMFSFEMPFPLKDFSPENKRNFGISLRLMMGLENREGSDSFDIIVRSPDWIRTQHEQENFLWGNNLLIVLEYDFF